LNNGKDNLRKFDANFDEGINIGYALNGHAYRVFNKRLLTVEESMHVVFDLECDDLRTVLHKNDLIDIDENDSHAIKDLLFLQIYQKNGRLQEISHLTMSLEILKKAFQLGTL